MSLEWLVSIKALGIAAGALLFIYAFAILRADEFSKVSDKYASAFSTVGLILIFFATGGYLTDTMFSVIFETLGYAFAIVGGTAAFVRISNHQRRYKEA